jgi:polysaccharide pyruvyl transferase WcaK-like protein
MRVGILTFHEVVNPGAFWQAYATCEVLRRLGHEPVIIHYTPPVHRYRPFGLGILRHPRNWLDGYLKNRSYERSQTALLPLSRRVVSHEDIMTEYFDAVVIGADIVWDFRSPRLGMDPVYFGEFLNTPKLISWAASMGGCNPDGEIPPFVREGLPKFKALSVRDEKTAALVRTVSGREAVVIPDPALNLNIDAIPRGKSPAGSYIAVYAIPDLVSGSFISQARSFAARKGLPLCAVGYRAKWADHNFVNASPEDWVSTFERSEYVLTNTFHGTIFSILLGKQFVTEYNPAIESKTKGMMEYLGLSARILRQDVLMEDILHAAWEYRAVKQQIDKKTKEADKFLQQALDQR